MKQTLLLLALSVISVSSMAQFTKGEKILGGSFQFRAHNYSNSSDVTDHVSRSVNMSVLPTLGLFSSPTLMHGFSLIVNGNTTKAETASGALLTEGKGFGLGAGYFLRKYIPMSEKIGAYGQAGANFTYSKSESENPNTFSFEDQAVTYRIPIDLGLYFMAGEKCLITTDVTFFSFLHQRQNLLDQNTKIRSWNAAGPMSSAISISTFYRFTK